MGRCRKNYDTFFEKSGKLTNIEKAKAEFIMSTTLKPYEMITDAVTGKDVPNVGAEENRLRGR